MPPTLKAARAEATLGEICVAPTRRVGRLHQARRLLTPYFASQPNLLFVLVTSR